MLATGAVPAALAIAVVRITAVDDRTVRVDLASDRTEVACPVCGTVATRVHSRYHRTLADLPWQGLPVQLCLTARRFFCELAACPRRIFAERVPGLVAARSRRSSRLQALITAVGVALGGEAGARLVQELALQVRPGTLLRRVRALPEMLLTPPRVLGIERHQPVDLLPDRNADTVARWLEEHPGVQVVSRDRAREYADGAQRGAPEAVQLSVEPAPLKTYGGPQRTPAQERAEQTSQAKHGPKLAQYAEIQRLHAAGATIKHIAEQVGRSRVTVYRYLRLDGPPDRKRPQRSRHLLGPYEPFLRQRWEEGCRTKAQLLREVREQGYTHSRRTVYRFLQQVERTVQASGLPTAAPAEVPSPRHVATLLVQRLERLTKEEGAYLKRLCAQAPCIATASTLTQDFARMVRDRRGEQLDRWLTQAKESGCKELAAFARGLETDDAAVKAGLLVPWSNGQIEGQVNNLKLVKRQMDRRAHFDLPRLRVLHVA